jgi:two-component system CheB/CheR fusion protein
LKGHPVTNNPPEEKPPAAPAEGHADDATPGGPPFPVVGVGASAGGLEAFSSLLQSLPSDPGMAFLFVLHLEPHHKSHLPEILAKVTPLPVLQVEQGMAVEVNHVYCIPPNTEMALTDGRLTLSPRSPRPGHHMPIDHLFRSLAHIQKGRSIGVLLSGGGTDGALGFQSIKAEGGITFAQDEKSARQGSMPRTATLAGFVDYVLPPASIAQELIRVKHHPYARTPTAAAIDTAAGGADVVPEILALLHSSSDVDFTHYKQSTIKRRILRRMALRGTESLPDYARQLREDPAERSKLYDDFLIRVTQFFRDPEGFEALKEKVFPAICRGHGPNMPIRVWVACCSTGEEVYSLAISLLEFLEGQPQHIPLKILATDLNEPALEKARAGLYLDNIEIDVSPERLRRFFVRIDGHYQISKAVREQCVFSRHNLASDPPFSHLDLISCRNVLIYMDTSLQKRVLPALHYALKPDAFLFLGGSENVGTFTDLFGVVDARHRIFAKRPVANPIPLDFRPTLPGDPRAGRGEREGGPIWSALDVQREADRLVLTRYAPVGVVIDEQATVLQFRGRTSAYLEPAPGMASLDLFRMLREGLLAEVRSAVTAARAGNTEVVREGVRVPEADGVREVKIEVIPFKLPPSGPRFFLVLFVDQPAAPAERPPARVPAEVHPSAAEQQLLQQQQELAALREYLQSVIEEQESTNEELKSANEEILSANEELQSTNEELQTAKEEAQSANEELTTVNEELRHRNSELARVNNDLINLLSGVNIPIVMVSRDLRIRRFTPLAEKLFNMIATDVGRPMSDIKPNLDVPDLPRLTAKVIDTLTPHEADVRDNDGRWYSLRIRPYVTLDSKIDGASIVLVDINGMKRSLEQMKQKQGGS